MVSIIGVAFALGLVASSRAEGVNDTAKSGTMANEVTAVSGDLVVHYCFDDPDALGRDCSDSGYDGIAVGDAAPAEGKTGGALAVAGQGWVEIPTAFFFDRQCDITICAFVNYEADDTVWHQVMASGDWRGGTDPIHLQFGSGRPLALVFEDTNTNQRIAIGSDETSFTLQKGVWHFMAVTLEELSAGSRMRLYFDSELVASVESEETVCIGYDAPMATQIGAIHGDQTWIGRIDEVQVYRRALTGAELEDVRSALLQRK